MNQRSRKIIELLAEVSPSALPGNVEVRGISCNSKDVRNGYIFVAVKGARDDGSRFIAEAVRNGACAVIAQETGAQDRARSRDIPVPFITVTDARAMAGRLASRFYGDPCDHIKTVGVTGTNGKTTITYLLEAVLAASGRHPAVIGTINYRFKGMVIPSVNTTPGPVELNALLADMVSMGADFALMEVSSHALDQGRTSSLTFHSALFTNLTQDHLDYHKTMEAYAQAKAKLFRQIEPPAFAVLNADDAAYRLMSAHVRGDVITYAIDAHADIRAANIRYALDGTVFDVTTPGGTFAVRSPLIGRHNVYNISAVMAWAWKEGLDRDAVVRSVGDCHGAPGRLQRIDTGSRGFHVFVDYAHTEDALRNTLNALRGLADTRILLVFGCGGDRDALKRPAMGRAACELADYAVLTNDNPRSEDPMRILDQIQAGMTGKNYCVVPDRREAISRALSLARPGDTVLVAGKGHEAYQILGDQTIPFDDAQEIRQCLQSMK